MRIWLMLALLLSCHKSMAALVGERIGRLEVNEILIRPILFSREGEGAEFSFADSYFSLRWKKDQSLSATVAIGSILQRGIPVIYLKDEPRDELGFFEAYAEYAGLYGTFRAGLLPLNFGYFGVQADHDRILPRPMIYENRVMGLRDYGVSFFTTHNGFFTEIIAHNGEVDQTQDGNIWVTGRWGWGNDRNFEIQASAQTGRTRPVSTVNGSTTLTGWDPARSAQWRFAALSVYWYPRRWEVAAQFLAGGREQNDREGGLVSSQFEVVNYIGDHWGMGMRHDQLDLDKDVSGDRMTRISLLALFKNADATSLLSLMLTKNVEEKNEQPNDEIRLSWRLTPFAK